MNKTLSPRRNKAAKEDFYAALRYLIASGFRQRDIANNIGVDRSTVNKWLKRRSMPNEKVIVQIVQWCIAIIGLNEILQAAIDKMNELGPNLQESLYHFGKTPDTITSSLISNDILRDSIESKTISNWLKGKHEPWPQKGKDFLVALLERNPEITLPCKAVKRIKGTVSNETERKIKAEVARETGLRDRIYYSLFPIFAPLGAVPELTKYTKAWRDWCAEYER